MAKLGFIFIGMLTGLFLSLTLIAFGLIRLDAQLREDLLNGRLRLARFLGRGEARQATVVAADLSPKVRNLQEELRITRKLSDQTRAERDAALAEVEELRRSCEQLRQRQEAAEEEIRQLRTVVDGHQSTVRDLQDELIRRAEKIARCEDEIRSLNLEIELLHRDEDTANLEQIQDSR